MALSKEIQEAMNNIGYRYVHEIRMNIEKVLNQPKYTNSGQLRASVRSRLKVADDNNPPEIIIEFLDYGDLIGKKKLLWTKMPPIIKIAEWVKSMGFEDSSAPVPGYKNGAPNLPAYKRAERIAFAMAVSKRKNDTFKRKPWKKESLPAVLKAMNSETYTQFAAQIEQLFKQSLEGKG